jgi:hypothetical protein
MFKKSGKMYTLALECLRALNIFTAWMIFVALLILWLRSAGT